MTIPDKWVDAWRDEKHPHHERVMRAIRNTSHRIGTKVPVLKWTYSPQTEWFNNPRFIVLMENYDTEMQRLLQVPISRKNATRRMVVGDELSTKNVAWLQHFYRADLELYRQWQRVPVDIRLGAGRDGDRPIEW
jgi:hypothetical protein